MLMHTDVFLNSWIGGQKIVFVGCGGALLHKRRYTSCTWRRLALATKAYVLLAHKDGHSQSHKQEFHNN